MENDGDFKDRVDKVFGSISSSSASLLWSVTDATVERREWKRSTRNADDDQIPVSSSFCFNQQQQHDHDDDIDFHIRSSIGLDPTLDHEDEEDEYDKMAQGKENNNDCLFMKDVTCFGPYLNSHNVINNHPFSTPPPDPSLITRLKENDDDDDEPMLNPQPPFTPAPPNDGICRTKSILKRKNDHVSKPAKRVRFDPTCKNQDDDDELKNVVRVSSNNGSGVPDYILNPSKYTRYNLDDLSHHANEGSNSGPSLEPKSSVEFPRSPVFIPRKKKPHNSEGRQSSAQAASSIAVAAQHGDTSEIQGDDVCTKADKFQKPDRRYRSKIEEDDNVC